MFVTGKDPVLTGKHAQMTGFSRHLTGKIQVQSLWVSSMMIEKRVNCTQSDWTSVYLREMTRLMMTGRKHAEGTCLSRHLACFPVIISRVFSRYKKI